MKTTKKYSLPRNLLIFFIFVQQFNISPITGLSIRKYGGGLRWLFKVLFIWRSLISYIGILAHAKFKATIFDLGKKVSHFLVLIYSVII